jgi:polyisoprenoid-binding protein YceI
VEAAMRGAVAVLVLAAAPAHAASEAFLVEPSHTYPGFAVSHLGISTQRGRFDATSGRIVLDREAGTGSIEIRIDAATVSTGNRLLDAVVKGEDFLDVARHPAMTYRSSRITFSDGVPASVDGELTMAGVTRPVALGVTHFGCTRLPFLVRLTCGADLVGTLSRAAFGITSFAGLVGDEVRLEIQVEAVRQEAAPPPSTDGG